MGGIVQVDESLNINGMHQCPSAVTFIPLIFSNFRHIYCNSSNTYSALLLDCLHFSFTNTEKKHLCPTLQDPASEG